MANGGLFSALGAALRQGARTFGELTEQERALARQAERDRLEQERFKASQRLQEENLRLRQADVQRAEEERQRRIVNDAIEGMKGLGEIEVSQDLFDRAKQFGMENLFNVRPTLNVTEGMPIEGEPSGPATSNIITRRVPQQELAQAEQLAQQRAERERMARFREHMLTPEHLAESFDQQQLEAHAHGINNLPMSSKEFDRREAVRHRNTLTEINARANRPQSGGNALKDYVSLVNTIEDNVRGKYASRLSALATQQARMIAEGVDPTPLAQEMATLEAQMQREIDERVKALGPTPGAAPQDTQDVAPATGDDPTEELIASLDATIQQYGDANRLIAEVLKDQAALRQAGVDVPRYVAAIRERVQTPQAAQAPSVDPASFGFDSSDMTRFVGGNPNPIDLSWLFGLLSGGPGAAPRRPGQ